MGAIKITKVTDFIGDYYILSGEGTSWYGIWCLSVPVITGAMNYPENLLGKLKELGLKVDALDALSLAQEAGSSKAVNLVLLGRLSNYFQGFTEEEWMAAIEQSVPVKFLEMNKKAFHLGRTA